MANPNIVGITSIYGKTAFVEEVPTSASAIVTNAASSGKVIKINSLIIANIDGTNPADVNVQVRTANGVTVKSYLANTITVPADATLIVISKDTSIYLEEDMALMVEASAASDLSATCSYEEIN